MQQLHDVAGLSYQGAVRRAPLARRVPDGRTPRTTLAAAAPLLGMTPGYLGANPASRARTDASRGCNAGSARCHAFATAR
jgi:hypothetical protein